MEQNAPSSKPWQELAAEAAREKDPKKREALTRELELALEERDKQRQRAAAQKHSA